MASAIGFGASYGIIFRPGFRSETTLSDQGRIKGSGANQSMSEIVQTAAVETTPPEPDTGGIGGHPKGLTTLFFTEMWERFSFYGLKGILVFYMVHPPAEGGLGYDDHYAQSTVFGTYAMSVYLLGLPGGFIADRFLGARMAVLLGGIVIACGHFSMAYPSVVTFYLGLCLIAAGTGLLKPNISSMVGGLYSADDSRRESGFSIFYMGINIGATLAPLVCGYLAQGEGFKRFLLSIGVNPNSCWHWGFGAAGVGMTLGLVQYLWHWKRLEHVGSKPRARKASAAAAPPASLTPDEWKRIGAIFVLFVFSILFWAVYEQAASSFSLFADRMTRNEIFGWTFPSSWYQTLPAVFVISLAPVFAVLWLKMGSRQPSSPAKFAYALLFVGISAALLVPASLLSASGRVSPLWLVSVYFISVVGELCLSPVGMSAYTKLSPPRFVGLMMGVWFVSLGFGNKAAGLAAGLFQNNPGYLARLFGYMALALLGSALILALMTPWVRKLMGKVH
jgi:POT family proton-dependent oligopeptide transporter